MDAVDIAKKLLRNHEGYALRLYRDSLGNLTIGIGRNLENGISDDEVQLMLNNDINKALSFLNKESWFQKLNIYRQAAVIDMAFNLGQSRFNQFHKMLTALTLGQYEVVANEMLSSLWAQQVGGRANQLAEIMRTGTIVAL